MISKLSHAGVLVLDQNSAKQFYTETLGFTVRNDVEMGADFAGAGQGFRWLTVSPPGQQDLEFILAAPEMGHDEETARQLRDLVAKGAFGGGVWQTDDCRKDLRRAVPAWCDVRARAGRAPVRRRSRVSR